MKIVKALLVVQLVFGASVALAQTFQFGSTGQGWITENGDTNSGSPNSNYIAGQCNTCDDEEYRNHFQFLPEFDGAVVSARLILDTASYESINATETYQVTSRPQVFGFDDLGTGTFYGSRTYSIADDEQIREIELNNAAIAAISSGQPFRVGGRVTTISGLAGPDEDETVFFSSGGSIATLEITVGQTEPVPSLQTWSLILLGMVMLMAVARLRRRQRQP